jgi:predicted AAA+ superfamily ATPase
MFIERITSHTLRKAARQFPVLALTGPRQSGKTTLVKKIFSEKPYVTLEDLDTREFAEKDPRGFLANYEKGAIFDEIQRGPGLFSYIQGVVDRQKDPGQFVLTGSQNFLLHERITQSLAGRVALVTLLPLSIEEVRASGTLADDYSNYLFNGFYPRLYETLVETHDW